MLGFDSIDCDSITTCHEMPMMTFACIVVLPWNPNMTCHSFLVMLFVTYDFVSLILLFVNLKRTSMIRLGATLCLNVHDQGNAMFKFA